MRVNTTSAGKPKMPTRAMAMKPRIDRLSTTRPKKPLRSPGTNQRGVWWAGSAVMRGRSSGVTPGCTRLGGGSGWWQVGRVMRGTKGEDKSAPTTAFPRCAEEGAVPRASRFWPAPPAGEVGRGPPRSPSHSEPRRELHPQRARLVEEAGEVVEVDAADHAHLVGDVAAEHRQLAI